ncbi:GntR family transcriptional regulator [Streptomyces tateyamensis]|uniref:GntR family transcriptional regulator n=1 Tax=Streptomyces tateyamensis TaxID=565073 RepID=A0A2V4N190_9ACTN|nr:GntR family transcriptional regulator [Streptomyces tateyamensis]PYC68199.1 GntR family transcriptional regulator [Streptomyces tateyamensis]
MTTELSPTTPPYLRIAAELRGRIASGALRPGDRVPSTRQITQEWGVAMATATKALTTLRQEGLVRSQPGAGTVVAPGADRLEPAVTLGAHPRAATPKAPVAKPASSRAAAEPAATRRREHRESEQGLSRDRIVQAAVTVADAEGLGPVSMRRVATELGVAPMALYRHVAGKEELVDLMADRMLAGVPLPPAELSGWRPRLAAIARVQWGLYRRHPWLAQTISLTRPVPLPGALRHGEYVLASLEEAGLKSSTRLYIHIMMFALVRGIAVNLDMEANDQRRTAMTEEEWLAAQEGDMLQVLAGGGFPAFSRLMVEMGHEDFDFDLDLLFEFALARILDGLTPLLEPRD